MIDGLWEKANKVSEIGYKLDSLAGIAELVAERLTDNAESGACWTIAEMLREYGERLEKLSEELMQLNKGKKK
jgi:DNA polymerase/3'-5' exonuclease PolX